MTVTWKAHDKGNAPLPASQAGVSPRESRSSASATLAVMVDAGGFITSLSPSITAALGFTPEHLLGARVELLAHPDDAPTLREILATGGASESDARELLCRLGDSEGSWRWVTVSAASMVPASAYGAVLLTFRNAAAELAPSPSFPMVSPAEHFVQLYESDDFLVESVSAYLEDGLAEGEVCIVLATETHRNSFEDRLRARNVDIAGATAQGRYLSLDAAETLARLMVDGMPDPKRFDAVIGALVESATSQRQHARMFGEMVALLWEWGQMAAAINLEEQWNDLRARRPNFTLCCAYPSRDFEGKARQSLFSEMCAQHSHVVPDESYTGLATTDARMRAISLLQQKAGSLNTETKERMIAEERLRLMAESMPQKIYTATPNGDIDYFNPQCMRYTGLPFEAIKEWGWTRFIHEDDLEENLRQWRRSLETGEPFYFEHRFRRADGVYCWHMTRAVPMRDADGAITMWIGSSTDIDEQKQLEQRKNAFISMASHELKTPVTSLKGFTQVLQRRLRKQQDADPQILMFLDRMDAQLRKMTGLISDLLDVSKMQTGVLDIRETIFDLDALVRETVENIQATSATHTIRVEGETRALISGDPDRIGQALVNLLTNAIKYSPGADAVVVHLRADHEQVEVAVRDFGMGIAEEYHERIFEQFYQATDDGEGTFPGLGIGLYIARTLVERHGGRLRVESAIGRGSVFRLTLPLANEREADANSTPLGAIAP